MCETNDGFRIAEKDMEIRGPGISQVPGKVDYWILNWPISWRTGKSFNRRSGGQKIIGFRSGTGIAGNAALRNQIDAVKKEKHPGVGFLNE